MGWHANINNGSSNSSGGSHDFDNLDMDAMERGYYGFNACVILLGTTINLWMLVAIVTSPELRSRLRNKLLCMLLFNNFLKSTVVAGAILARLVASFQKRGYDCSLDTFARTSRYFVMWIENTFLVIFLIRYLVVLCNNGPIKMISSKITRIGTNLMLACPWIINLVVVPSVVAYHSHARFSSLDKGCLVVTRDAYMIVRVFGTVVPFFLKLALLVTILIFHYRWRVKKNATASTLIEPTAAQIDNVAAYIAICTMSALTQVTVVAYYVGKIPFGTPIQGFIYIHSAWAIVEARGVFMPLCFLFFTDLRHRLKSWRPWHCSGPSTGFRVQYQSKDDDLTERTRHY